MASVDHQRGYHPDPYWGGIFDAFRQPKYAYYMFRSQTAADLKHPLADCGPMVYIAHEMSPFSDKDVVIFSNCDSVRLSVMTVQRVGQNRLCMQKGICRMRLSYLRMYGTFGRLAVIVIRRRIGRR